METRSHSGPVRPALSVSLPVDGIEGNVNEIGNGSLNVIGRIDPDKTGNPALTVHVIVNSLDVIGRGSFDGIGNGDVTGKL